MENQQPPQALPRPTMEPGQHVITPADARSNVGNGEQYTGPQQYSAPSAQSAATPAATQQPSAQSSTSVTQSLPVDNPAIADDSDLIEKEWVVRAKQIVSSTHDDPYQQNRSIMRLRADYLKKRYNKDLDMGKA